MVQKSITMGMKIDNNEIFNRKQAKKDRFQSGNGLFGVVKLSFGSVAGIRPSG